MRSGAFLSILVAAMAGLLRSESGPFQGLPRYEVGDPQASNPLGETEGPKSVAAVDLDLDGHMDLAAGNLDGSVSVLRNRGDGTFDPQILICAGGSLRGIAAADFTGDAIPDIAAADITGHLILLRGEGDGTLTEAHRFDVRNARALVPCDFDLDGAMDLAVVASWPKRGTSSRAQLQVFFGTGDGTFESVVLGLPEKAVLFDLETADLGDDGIPDILALDQIGRRLLVYFGDGNRGFRLAQELGPLGRGPYALCVALLDERSADGAAPAGATLDVVVASRDSSVLTLYRGRPDGLFDDSPAILYAGAAPRSLAAADLDGDGWNELLVVNRNDDGMTVLRGEGEGRFAITSRIPTGKSPRAVVAADLTGDGVPDAAVASRISADIRVYPGRRGLAGFQIPRHTYPAGISPIDVIAEDFDRNGRIDVAVANARSHDLRVRLAAAGGELGPETAYAVPDNPNRMVTSDFDEDGNADIALVCLGSEQGTRGHSREGAIVSLLGRGDGTFEAAISSSVSSAVTGQSPRPYALRAADLDGDGYRDLAVSDTTGGLMLFRGIGDGTFAPGIRKGSLGRSGPVSIAAGDFDRDGDVDIATSMVQIVLNEGDLFDPKTGIRWKPLPVPADRPIPIGDHVIETGDLNGDGTLDLAVAITFVSSRPDPIVVYFGRGNATFDGPYELPTGQGVTSIALADFTGDGIADIVTGNRCAASITFLKGLGGERFERLPDAGTFPVEDLAAGDFNADGRLDLVGVGGGLWVLPNGGDPGYKDPEEERSYGLAIEEKLYINEVMASNVQYSEDTLGRTPDWVEIYNHTPTTLDLSGCRLRRSDLPERSSPRFRRGTIIPPGGHLVVYCDAKAGRMDEIHMPFKLPREGAELVLTDSQGATIDCVTIPPQREDMAYGRVADGAHALAHNPVPSPGLPNTKPANLPPLISSRGFALNSSLRRRGLIEVLLECSDETGIQYASARFVWKRGDGGIGEVEEVPLESIGATEWGGLFSGAIPIGRPRWPDSLLALSFCAVDFDGRVTTLPADSDTPWYTLAPRVDVPPLRIREVVPANQSGVRDEKGRYADWLVVQNFGSEPASLDGFALTKDVFLSEAWWRFPPGKALAGGEALLVFCDKDVREGLLHTPFNLNADGDEVHLIQVIGDPPVAKIVEAIRFGAIPPDTAFGVTAAGEDPHVLDRPNPPPPYDTQLRFVRGDVDASGALELGDAISIVQYLFAGGSAPCEDAADVDDDGGLALNDPIRLFEYMFRGGPPPAPPFPSPGPDPTPDALKDCRAGL